MEKIRVGIIGAYDIAKAYGSYEEMVKDADVDLVYAAVAQCKSK